MRLVRLPIAATGARVTTIVTGVEVLFRKTPSPIYLALTESVPIGSVASEKIAVPSLPTWTESMIFPSSVKSTTPVGGALLAVTEEIDAVNITASPATIAAVDAVRARLAISERHRRWIDKHGGGIRDVLGRK